MCSSSATCLQCLCNLYAAALQLVCGNSATCCIQQRHQLASIPQTDGVFTAFYTGYTYKPDLPSQPVLITIEFRFCPYPGSLEHSGYPLLFFGANQPFALTAMVIIAFARKAPHDPGTYCGCQLQRNLIEKAGHTAGIMQRFVGTVALAG